MKESKAVYYKLEEVSTIHAEYALFPSQYHSVQSLKYRDRTALKLGT